VKQRRRIQSTDLLWGSAVLALVVLQFWWLPGEQRTSSDSYSASIDGKLGLYRTLSELFPNVSRDPRSLLPPQPAALLLIAPDRYPTTSEQNELREFVRQGGTLLFAPNWSNPGCDMPALGFETTPLGPIYEVRTSTATGANPPVSQGSAAEASQNEPELPAESDASDAQTGDADKRVATAETESDVAAADEDLSIPPGESNLSPKGNPSTSIQSMDSDNLRDRSVNVAARSDLTREQVDWRKAAILSTPAYDSKVLVRSDSATPEVVAWRLGNGTIVACSSPDIFSNRSLLESNSRRLAIRLVEYCQQSVSTADGQPGPIVLCEFLTASEAYRHAGILLSPALRIGSLQLMLLAVLAGWYGFHRFGPPRIVDSEQRRNLSDSAIAVGDLQYRLNDGSRVIHQYMDYVNTELRRKYGGTVQLDNIAEIIQRTGFSEAELTTGMRNAERLQSKQGVSAAATAKCIHWLAVLKQRLAGPDTHSPQATSDRQATPD
jgi:hypothetical protein